MKSDDELAVEMDQSIGKTLSLRDLDIYYDPVSDTLSLWNGTPANYGETVAQHLTAESNAEGIVTGITLENAAKILLPYLAPDKVERSAPGTASGETRPS